MNTLPNPLHGDWVDSIAECSCCGGSCAAPQACQQPEPVDQHARQRWLIVLLAVVLGAVICAVCVAGYREALPW